MAENEIKKYLDLDGLKNFYNNLKVSIAGGDIAIGKAEYAANADSAKNAEEADYAIEAGNAGYATNAGHAASADTATVATSATSATKDGNGNIITDIYETKANADAKLAAAKEYTDNEIAALDDRYYTESEINSTVADLNNAIDLKADITDYNETIIGLTVNGTTVTYIKGDGSTYTFETQDTNTTYSLGTDEITGLTKLYATTGSAEDGTMTQKAIKTELDKKVGVTIDDSQNTLVFTR